MKKFKQRASAAGNIAGGTIGLTENQQDTFEKYNDRANGNGKPLTPNMEKELSKLVSIRENPPVPQGLKTVAEKWLISETFGITKHVSSKYFKKGNQNEDASIDMVAEHFGFGFLTKNEDFFEDEHFTGTPDIIIPNQLVIDVKNSWDIHTFPHFAETCPNDLYFYQLQVYMYLLKIDKARLVYTLTNTPVDLIEREASRYCYDNGLDPNDADVFNEFERRLTFDDIPTEKKIKSFDFEFDQSIIDMLVERVELVRTYIKTLSI